MEEIEREGERENERERERERERKTVIRIKDYGNKILGSKISKVSAN